MNPNSDRQRLRTRRKNTARTKPHLAAFLPAKSVFARHPIAFSVGYANFTSATRTVIDVPDGFTQSNKR